MKVLWDIDSSSDRENIEKILRDLARTGVVPGEAIDAIQGLLERAERTAETLARVRAGEKIEQDIQIVSMPEMTRQPHTRDVPLVEHTFTCKICGKTQTIKQYPGNLRTICSREDNPECRREVWRQRKRIDKQGDQ